MGSKKSTTTTTHDVSQDVEDASRQAVNLGTKIASRPYQAYTGERYAPMSANEKAGINLAASSAGGPQQYLDRAGAELSGIKKFPDSDITAYMNPHTDAAMQPALRNLEAASGRASRAATAGSGPGSSSGNLLQQSAVQKNLMQGISDTTAQGRSQAFQQAQQTWGQDQDRHMRAAAAWRDTAGDIQKMNSQQIKDLMFTGNAARVAQQANKDFDYQQFTENRDWDVHNLGPLLDSLKVPHDETTKTVTKKKSGFGQILGAVATVAGIAFAPVTGGASLAVGGAVAKAAGG